MTQFEAVAAIVSSAGVVITAVLLVLRRFRRLSQFLDDYFGEKARPGVEARPGVMERLKNLDDGQLAILERLGKVEAQVHPNGGATMADAVNRIERKVNADAAPASVTVTYSKES